MLVIYCCITNYPKLGIKWHIFMILKFLCIKNEFGLGGCSGPGSPTKLRSLPSSSKLFQKDPFPYLLSDWWGIRFLTGCYPRASVVQELLATDRPSIPCDTHLSIEHLTTWYLASSEQQRGETESMIERWKSPSLGISSVPKVTSHNFCHILFFSSSLGLRKCSYSSCWHVQTHESKELDVSYEYEKFLPQVAVES